MTIYYLQQHEKDKGHQFIDVKHHTGFVVINQTEANSWLEAKQKMGMDITPGHVLLSKKGFDQ